MFLNVLSKYTPLRKKRLRANHASYVFKSMRKAIMRRSNLKTFQKKNGQIIESVQKKKVIAVGFTKRNVKYSLTN